ncbi:MAG: D-hexose-6-phosphate mutarotase, partial [Armatimonadota bacterium]|nr:D-hexose-6-phosphate mutarotase [Armatimonadota bacterium]
AHVTSWTTSKGEELFFLSRAAYFEAEKPIRGGIPVIFPQFGQGPLPQHGFARLRDWEVARTSVEEDGRVAATLQLDASPETLALWPHPFHLELGVCVGAQTLALTFRVCNPGNEAFPFQAVFHTYFAVEDVRQSAVYGLKGVSFIDSLRQNAREVESRDAIRFDGEIDRVYVGAPHSLRIEDAAAGRRFYIEKERMPDVTVWNPWVEKAQRLADFGDEEWPRMLCVETGVMDPAYTLAPGETWEGVTTFRVEER